MRPSGLLANNMRPLKGGLSVGCGPHGGFLCQYIDNELSAKLKKARARTPQIAFQRHSKTTFNGFKSVPLGVKVYLWGVQKCTSGGLGLAARARGSGSVLGLMHGRHAPEISPSRPPSLPPAQPPSGCGLQPPRGVRSQLDILNTYYCFFLENGHPAYVGASLTPRKRSGRGRSPWISAKPFGLLSFC